MENKSRSQKYRIKEKERWIANRNEKYREDLLKAVSLMKDVSEVDFLPISLLYHHLKSFTVMPIHNFGLKTVGDLLNLELHQILKVKGIGNKGCTALRRAYNDLCVDVSIVYKDSSIQSKAP